MKVLSERMKSMPDFRTHFKYDKDGNDVTGMLLDEAGQALPDQEGDGAESPAATEPPPEHLT